MTKSEPIDQLRIIITKDSATIPSWIDTTSPLHNKIYREIQRIYIYLSRLTQNRILSKLYIKGVAKDIEVALSEIIRMSNKHINILVCEFILKKIRNYHDKSIELELYEVAENFKKFTTMIND